MSGHNKWSTIKHKKAKEDAKRGKIFTKLIKEITLAARMGGGDEETNPRLRTAVQNARAANMPNDNVKKAILKGTGELPGVVYEESTYEGYGPGGVAVLVEVATDNKNRTVAEVRHIFTKYGGNLGENGCVAWIFESKGMIMVPAEKYTEEEIFEKALEAGAEDVKTEDDFHYIFMEAEDLHEVTKNFEDLGVDYEQSELTRIPTTEVELDEKTARQVLKLVDALEDSDDVQKVFSNSNISDEILEILANE